MIVLCRKKRFLVIKRLRIIGILDSNNSFFFKALNLLLESLFLPDLWFIIGLSRYYLYVDGYEKGEDFGGEVLGCLGILGKNLIYDCVVDRRFRGGSIMRGLISFAVRTIKAEGFVPKLDCIPRLRSYYEGLGFEAYKHTKNDFKMRYTK